MRIQKGQPALVLAPMEGVTDAPIRALMSSTGAFTACVSEFLRISQNVPPAKVFFRHIPELAAEGRTASGVPVAVQLLGGHPERLAAAASLACELGAPAIDLNFGCPAKTVNRHDGGATLLQYPERIRAIVAAVRAAVPPAIPVSAKLRLGWDDIRSIHRNADEAALGGAAWLTIHARTRMQGYAPPVFWAPIGEVRRRLEIPVVANGDIWSREDFLRCREATGAEHFMMGRGVMADPLLAVVVAEELGLSPPANPWLPVGSELADWFPLFDRFRELTQHRPSNYALRRIKQWSGMAERHGRIAWFGQIKRVRKIEEIFSSVPGPFS